MANLLLPELAGEPARFVRTALTASPWRLQEQILQAIHERDRITVRSCHGVGKTWLAAAAALWFCYTRSPAVVITTAPTFRQVKQVLWRELRTQHLHLPENSSTVNQTELRIDESRFALGLSTDEPDQFQGFHSPNLLVIADEAAGIAEPIFEAIDGLLTSEGAKLLLIGNPTSADGTFRQSHEPKAADTWAQFRISAFDSPNLQGIDISDAAQREQPAAKPMLVTPAWVWDKLQRWGEESPSYQSRVLGEFPAGGSGNRPHFAAGRAR